MATFDVKYQPYICPFLRRDIWAILAKQPDGSWKIVNCLDKDKGCVDYPCAFIVDGGEWPFEHAVTHPHHP